MRNHLQALDVQPAPLVSPAASRAIIFPRWVLPLRFLSRPQSSRRSNLGLTGLGLAYIFLLGLLAIPLPGSINLDGLYLFGCLCIAWAAGQKHAALLVLISVALQFHHDSVAAPTGLRGWILYWDALLRLVSYGGLAWLAASAGLLARRLQKQVQESDARLQNEVAERDETAELLVEATQLFRQVTDNITDVFWVTDATKTQVEFVSPGFENIWGRRCEELYASPSLWQQGIHPEDRERVTRAMFRKQVAGDYDEEYRVLRSDGALRWVHDRAFPVNDATGAVYRIVGVAEDITERKRAELLVQAERDLGAALSATSDLKVAAEKVVEIATQLEDINCAGLYLMNPQTGELRLEAHRALPGSFVEKNSCYRPDAAESRLARAGRITFIGQNQIPRSLEALWGSQGFRALALVPLQHKGEVLGILNLASFSQNEFQPRLRLGIELIASQVAAALARIAAEQSLRRSQAQLCAIVNGAPIALLAFDAAGTVTFSDGQALKAMGLRHSDPPRRKAIHLFNDFPLMLENVERALKGEEFSSVVPFGDHVLDFRFSPIRFPGETGSFFVAVATDISERFRLEHQILEISDREQARIGQDIHDGLCQQLVGAAFVANSLHQSLDADAHPEKCQTKRICGLLDDAITESRSVARGLYPVRLETEGLGPALAELAAITAERSHFQCRFEGLGEIQCDTTTATHLYRIAQEAINNAIKHSGGGSVTIRLTSSPREIQIEIRDDGNGMAASKPAQGRSGMGLHIMDYRARSIGGSMLVSSEPGGTRINCRIPK